MPSFGSYPDGVNRATQTHRLRHLAAITWGLGLSLRSVVAVFDAFGLELSRMTVWRDGQACTDDVQVHRQQQRVRVLGLDGTGSRVHGQPVGFVVAVDLGTGVPVAVAELDEQVPCAVTAWLEPLVTRLGVEVIVTDDLGSYRRVAEELGIYHQVCLWHLWRWVGRARMELRPQLPAEGMAFRHKTALNRLRQNIWHLHHGWQTYRLTYERPEVPRTNNGTEQAIGRFKARSKRVRGHKAWSGIERTLLLGSGPRS